MSAEDSHQKISTAGAHQTGNTQNLSTPDFETNIVDEQFTLNVWIFDFNVPCLKDCLTALVIGSRKDVADVTADHLRDHRRLIQRCCWRRTNGTTIAQNRYSIR